MTSERILALVLISRAKVDRDLNVDGGEASVRRKAERERGREWNDSPCHVVLVRESREERVVQLETSVFSGDVASDESLDGLSINEERKSARPRGEGREERETHHQSDCEKVGRFPCHRTKS